MSLKSSEKIDTNVYKLEIGVDSEKFEEAVNKAYLRNRGKISIPGFRKGKAPRHYIEKLYGENMFYEDAVEILYPEAVEAAIIESGLTPVDAPKDASVNEISKEGVEFTVNITVKPEVEVGEYKGLKAAKEEASVTGEEIDQEIKNLQERNARMITAEEGKAVEDGDIAVIDFEGFKDDVAFEGGKGENFELKVGSGQFIPGFEDQVIGHKAGEEFDVNVTFPEDYGAEELKGQPAVFKVKINEIKIKELPELDDEFVKDVSEFDTLEEFRKDVEAKILDKKKNMAESKFENELIDQLIEGLKAEIPEVMYERRIDENIQDFDHRLQMQGLNVNSYLQYTGMEVGAFRDGFKEQAQRQVKVRLALEKIAQLENIVPTEEEIAEEIDKMAKAYGVDADRIKAVISEKEISEDIAVRKAIDFVKDNAVVA